MRAGVFSVLKLFQGTFTTVVSFPWENSAARKIFICRILYFGIDNKVYENWDAKKIHIIALCFIILLKISSMEIFKTVIIALFCPLIELIVTVNLFAHTPKLRCTTLTYANIVNARRSCNFVKTPCLPLIYHWGCALNNPMKILTIFPYKANISCISSFHVMKEFYGKGSKHLQIVIIYSSPRIHLRNLFLR